MLHFIYPTTLLLVWLLAILWYFKAVKEEDTKKMKRLFWIVFLVNIPAFVIHYGLELWLLAWFVRDIFLLFIIVYIAHLFTRFKKLFVSLFIFVAIGVSALYFFSNQLNSSGSEEFVSSQGEIIFDIKNFDNIDEIEAAMAEYGAKIEKTFPTIQNNEFSELEEYFTIDIDDKNRGIIEEILTKLSATGMTDWVETNDVVQLSPIEMSTATNLPATDFTMFNDPFAKEQWALKALNMEALHSYLEDNKVSATQQARVFILDTGVDSEHEDLNDNYVSFSKNYDTDVQGHGTHCAGIANAVSNNKKGIASFSPQNNFVKTTSIKVLNDQGQGTQVDIIRGIITAADNGADVISMSLGGRSNGGKETAYNEAIKYANSAGAIVVVAAGNSNDNAKNHAPACCEGVITVSAVDNNLTRASFSNYVNDMKMGIAAPGVSIYSTFPKNQYRSLNGTSMATPYVAGLLGMMKALAPALTTKEAYDILKKSGKETSDTQSTGMFIQPAEALKAIQPGSVGFWTSIVNFFKKLFSF